MKDKKGEKGAGPPVASGCLQVGLAGRPPDLETSRKGRLVLVTQQSFGFFTLGLQGLTRILLEQFHFLPSYKGLLDLLL